MSATMVWHDVADGVYRCAVTRNGDRNGHLSVACISTQLPFVIHAQQVRITDGEPDPADVEEWRSICARVIDNPDARIVA